ncbi:molybdopterin-dependent oxidoreductase [Nocardioides sp. T2.26MG-1]|uniref:molybdopterin-dependent oxidoreductase n=1 Tax=Nocardioides sp. T2.26MG-1 TaxID=3041166 RepID=UPI00247769AF|nr:molybdopterin-dependent oxidoreductase [Nocardioides sp. T2.26MG-1]CAI9418964.1 Periplasmic nitrate reductase [Nocardioides sp. T2.26MG-1]
MTTNGAPVNPVNPPVNMPGARRHEGLRNYPPVEDWDHHVEYDAKAHPRKVPHTYSLIPTICFNCESSCGLLAYVDHEDLSIKKFEGNPAHPGSRGRNCAKGPATINQVHDPERILHPLKRVGERGSGRFERVDWDEVLEDIAARVRAAIVEDRRDEVMYHVGRPGEDGFAERVLQAWGIDGHNSHTNVCSSGGRSGYTHWMGYDRPSPDYANARTILLLSSHLETGHYFNPHAQRIMEAKQNGAKVVVLDLRLSNTASHADLWISPWPGSEGAIFLSVASYLLRTGAIDRAFIRRWVNWETYLQRLHPDAEPEFEVFLERLTEDYAHYSFEFAAQEAHVPVAQIEELARLVAQAGTSLATHTWRSAAAGNLGGWQIARSLFFLNVLTGSVGTVGGTHPNGWDKFIAHFPDMPEANDSWSEKLWPIEYPLTTNEMSILLPHLLKDGRGKLDVYFSRVYNPLWVNPDGFTWIDVLKDASKIGLHVALTPTWSESATFADYVLPMGHASERHDTMSFETHTSKWLAFRQPVTRVAMERRGIPYRDSRDTNPGEVWEENEFWFALSWKIDPDGSLGIRRYFESKDRPGEMMTQDEYYETLFAHSVPGLPQAAEQQGLSPLAYMRKYGVFEIAKDVYRLDERPLTEAELDGAVADQNGVLRKPVTLDSAPPLVGEAGAVGVVHADGSKTAGWLSPSRKLELYSTTLADWGWPEQATPGYIESHVSARKIDRANDEFVLMPNFRLPTLIHTRSGNAKYLNEIANTHPLWFNHGDADALGVATGDLVRVTTEIGHFVARAWATEAIRPGVVGLSHHMGRWMQEGHPGSRWVMGKVDLNRSDDGIWRLRYLEGVKPFKSDDPDSERIYWDDPGVHQNLAFPVQPDPISGMHCWHQKVRIEKAHEGDQYGDVEVDVTRSREVYRRWLAMTRPGPGPDGQRRPEFMMRHVTPKRSAYRMAAVTPSGDDQ